MLDTSSTSDSELSGQFSLPPPIKRKRKGKYSTPEKACIDFIHAVSHFTTKLMFIW